MAMSGAAKPIQGGPGDDCDTTEKLCEESLVCLFGTCSEPVEGDNRFKKSHRSRRNRRHHN